MPQSTPFSPPRAFHWFDDECALAETTRVLRPPGALILMWNIPAGPAEPSIAAGINVLAAMRSDIARPMRRCWSP